MSITLKKAEEIIQSASRVEFVIRRKQPIELWADGKTYKLNGVKQSEFLKLFEKE